MLTTEVPNFGFLLLKMKKYLNALIVLIIIGCQSKDISGHWHGTSPDFDELKVSIDIYNNNESYLIFSLDSEPIEGTHFPKENHIFFPGECGMFSFDYLLKNNKLYLESALGGKIILDRVHKNCTRIKDYSSLLNINPLTIRNQSSSFIPKDSIANSHLNQLINLDCANNRDVKIEFLNRINSIHEIDSIVSYIEDNHSKGEIPYINYIITPDQSIQMKYLKLLIHKIDPFQEKNIYIRTLKPNPVGRNIFEYISIDNIDFNFNGILKDFFY